MNIIQIFLWWRWQNWWSWYIWRWWQKPEFVVFLTIKYMNQSITVLKQNTTNSEYFIQESHLSILIYYWNIKSDGGDIWCWQIWHFLHNTFMYFSRRFYPKQLTLHSSYSFTFYQLLLSLGIEPMILALLAPCFTIWATGKQHKWSSCSSHFVFFLLMLDANGTCFRRIKWSKYFK